MWPLVALCCWGGLSLSLSPSVPQGRAGGQPGALLRAPTLASPSLEAPALPNTTESKVEKLGRAFKRQVRRLRARSGRLELVFLVDESSSVGPANFLSELRFVKKLLSDFPVVPAATRVAIVTFSSRSNVVPRVDYISRRRPQQHKCALLGREIPAIAYRGGGTYTKGAFQQAAQILRHARGNATKVIFLITDGYSNGGDPRPIAASLRELGVEIFTFGIWQGNIRELNDMASHPKEDHCYLLHSFTEFEALARRALHEDLPSGSYIQEDISHCSYLCEANENCCDIMASCKCGTHTGQFECICEKGYYGKGLQHECTACPPGTYKPEGSPGGISTCISCPDDNHTSPPGSTSLEDCTCQEGYRAVGQTCEVVHCPELKPPENGHFVQNVCNNYFNAACGIRCKAGFDLVGSSIRLCQPNGQWSGSEATCRVRTCPRLRSPQNGHINCSTADVSYKTVCFVTCNEGYEIEGNSKLTCQGTSQWDSKEPKCVDIEAPQIHCPDNIETVTLEHHNSANISWQVSVYVTPAFIPPFLLPIGEVDITYTATDKSGNEARCTFNVKVIDAEPPVVDRCRSPPPMQAENDYPVTWEEPEFSDNSGGPLTVTRSHAPGDLFPKGETTVQYTAVDPSGNNRTCEIHIVIKGSPCEVSFEPVNGDFICTSDEAGVNCTLHCAEGYSFSEGSSENYYCAYDDGIWKPPFSPEWPSCSLNRFANHGFKSFEMLYKATRCDDNNLLNSFTDAFQSALGKMVPSFCNDVDDIDCRLEDQTQKHCLEYNYDYENGFAIGPAGWGTANHLDYSYGDFVDAVQGEDLSKHLSTSVKAAPARVKRHKLNVPMTDQKIKLIFNITASVPLPDERNDTLELENQRRLLKTLETITNRLNRTLNKEPMYSFQFASELIVADTNSLETEKAFLFCRPGSVLRGRMCGEFSRTGLTPCYPCPRDYYQPDPGKSYCLSCPFYGTTTITGARSITDCSSFGSTFSAAEESIMMVPAFPENISKQYKVSSQVFHECFLEPCHNNGTCKQLGSGYICICPLGYTGLKCETQVDECKSSPCQNNGICKDGIGTFVCHCQPGYSGFLCEEDINECSSSPCLNGAHCVDGKNGYRCTCPKGFTGDLCEREMNECLSNPCLNRAVCEDRVGSFSCKCLPGFAGVLCERNIDECLSRPCRNGATCRDGINSFRCLCVTGYTGVTCEVNINDCDSSPCLNQATCVDALNSYVCKCPPGFTGSRCETEQSSGFNLDFEVSGIYGYVMLDGVLPSLGDITCTFWMKSTDTTNYGTPISYAVENGSDNAFLLTDYNGWVLYVNGKEKITDCPSVNDGNWHHIAVTWTCTDGAWKVYIDGKLSDGGSGLSVGSKIPGGGALVLGQEQDQKGEGFNPAESFVGSISQLNIWDHVLSPQQVESLATSCPEELQKGNVLAWPDFLPGVVGRVKIDYKSIFCAGISCGVPPTLENGFYSAEDFFAGSTVTYHCNIGYYLLGDSRMLCLDNGSWNSISPSCLDVDECAVGSDCDEHASCLNTNGSYVCTCIPPYTGDGKKCAAISCGAPVIPENSAIFGSNFTYLNKVVYRCNDGYNLVGEKEILCLASGMWNHAPPSCEMVMCPSPQDISNGKYTLSGTAYLSSVSYTCDNGYSLQGPSVLVCASSGNWNSTPPACNIVSCGSPPAIKDAVINGDNFTFGNTVSYTCKEGYTLVGPETIECLASGKWNVSHQQCLAVSCDEPPHVENASPESGHRLFGDIAYYFCLDGYSLADNSQLLCNAEGTWVPPEGRDMPHCIADFCEKPSAISYSILESISKAKFAAGSVVSFKCMEGFVLNTSAKIECLRGGQWNPSPLNIQCIPVRCGEPPHISNGYASGSNYSFGAVVAYSCNKGFYIKGEKKRTCEATGNWSGSLPTCHPVSCGEPPQLENGFIKNTTGHFFENQANYQCDSGYQMVGSPVFICQANRQWYSESPPYCAPLSCGKPPSIQHGYSKGETFDMGSKVEFFCDEGYELIGDVSWTCQKSGKWSKKQSPKCVPTKCPEPPLAENQLVLREVSYQVSVVQFSCKEGYVLHGSSVLKCLPSQQWNDSFPFCKLVQCSAPPYIPFGDPLTSSLHFGSTVKYICVDGFLMKGESTIRCQEDGSWSLPLPECIPVECPQPEDIQNGIVDVQGLTFLSTALYTCKPGFELLGNTTVLCGEDGQWLGGKPVCKPIQCPRPKKILNGKYSFTSFHYGQTVRYFCDRGFQLQGEETLRCLETGEWSTEVPSCKAINCQPPQPIENGFVEGADYSYGAMVIYSCVPGFQLSGLAMQTCEELGWSSSTPACLPTDCGLPPHIDFGEYVQLRQGERRSDQEAVTENPSLSHMLLADNMKGFKSSLKENSAMQLTTFLFGTIILYTCYSGYELLGNPVLACQEDGAWNGTAPACVSIECSLPSAPENGFLHVTENTLGSTVRYTCRPGFTLVGSDTRLCLPSRQWSHTAPYCEAITCSSPAQLLNGKISGENYTYGSVVYYECDPGYQLNGPTERRCQESQKWDGSEPICIPVSCSPPPVLENGQVTGEDYTFQRHTEYSCNEGFLLDGDRSRVCLANGSWSGITPVCKAVTCPAPLPLPNGSTSGSDFSFNKVVHYHCNDGYSLQGASTLTCQSDGTWDSEAPHCEPVFCGPPEDISHGFLNGSAFTYGEFVHYVCFPGYELHGNPLRHCLSNGSWSGSLPSCLPCLCPTPQIQNGVVLGTDFSCGISVQFQCLEGFKLLGPSEVTCEAAGKWSSGFPRCGQISCGAPPIIPNTFINGSSSEDENTIIYTCLTGFVMKGAPELTCVETGVWKKPYPSCELLSCGPPPSIPNAEILGNSYTYGSKVQYRCLEGYMMATEVDVCTCQEDGQWFPQSISCCPRKCPLPGNITNVIVLGNNFTVNTSITLSCAEGYTLVGPSTSTCKENGVWVPPFSDDICSAVSCGTPESPEHGFVIATKYNYKDVSIYKCDSGYELQGDAERTCQEDKVWSGTVPVCRRISCGPPDMIENGSVQGEEFLFGSEVFYSCDPGFVLQGPSRRICHVDKKWSPSSPTCVQNALLSEVDFHVGQNVSIRCREGYQLKGQSVISCNADETWTPATAKCEKISCGPPAHVENALIRGSFYQYGDMITYSCYSGYMLEGPLRSVCLENGTWTTPPTCKAVCRFPCQNGGVCERPNACSCPDGWMGRLCEERTYLSPDSNPKAAVAVCQLPCLNGGKCIRPNRCYCPSSWTGPDCSRYGLCLQVLGHVCILQADIKDSEQRDYDHTFKSFNQRASLPNLSSVLVANETSFSFDFYWIQFVNAIFLLFPVTLDFQGAEIHPQAVGKVLTLEQVDARERCGLVADPNRERGSLIPESERTLASKLEQPILKQDNPVDQ
ncbi:Sushi, von Willebrand factor type A, EGF and pentraxin domain-containing protein 1 [Turdus rufiventris]|nr:Sushi, von Willebrand factor type A, EGF and pentraxin domain-containing protein 1 [Turdus rufiventris]